jgi:hypothetical protein
VALCGSSINGEKMKKKLKFYTSFEAQREAEIEEESLLSVRERLIYTVALIKRVYSEELSMYEKPVKRKMYFIKTTLL